ncbi:hypothetical protein [Enterobacter quasiroggenkampii]|uniref:hypothetical protein n=1 Tax=Enterobacter quasiroggenkampii TaxID=2497436 RepID=UPI0021D3B535|nr:hypothetical protein [Enterobacter quasiroggenkampii]MCU6384240.1 hypothetical protein [Enterobacter quasiroggenkampii]MCU6392923.1 hypothetical protein [Enterobacter quasiroggenkampii]MCU6401564.1 hypothetical protein [Enterobacter quasiroggenkampii]MCU6416538.1 hypothetical protein [Enterobacter quasiroggenkampii]
MHSTNRANLYRAEKAVISSIIGGQLNDDIVNTCIEALINTNKNCNYNLAKSVNHFPRLLTNIDLSSDVLNLWQKQPKGSLNNPISNTEFINSRDYVENLMGVKLTNIQWRHLNYSPSEHSEGSCWPCGDDEHQIFTYHDPNGVISTDLLVHEIGHAADFTISRMKNDDDLLITHKSLNEAIAYYCQFKFLLEFGSPSQRIGSCGALSFAYLSILVLRYCLENSLQLHEVNADELVRDPSLGPLVSSYKIFDPSGDYGHNFVHGKIKEIQLRFENLGNLVHQEIQPRYGIILGIYLLDKSPEFINDLILKNSINNDINTISELIIENYDESIMELSARMFKYFFKNT